VADPSWALAQNGFRAVNFQCRLPLRGSEGNAVGVRWRIPVLASLVGASGIAAVLVAENTSHHAQAVRPPTISRGGSG
jgi:hypothetical protein